MTQDELTRAVLGPVELAVFENLYAAYAQDAENTARAIVRDPVLAVDVVHDAYLELLRHLLGGGRWHDPAAARAAVIRNVRWAARKALRSRARKRRLDIALDDAADQAAPDSWARWEAGVLCGQIVARLPESQRRALECRYVAGLSPAQAARQLGISLSAYEKRVARGLAAARKLARGWGMSPGALVAQRGRLWFSERRRAVGRTVRAAAAVGLTAATAGTLTALAPVSSPAPPAASLLAGVHRSAPANEAETVDDVVVLARAVSPAASSGSVLVVGEGRLCACQAAFRSSDRGTTWHRVLWTAGAPSDLLRALRLEVGGAVDVAACRPSLESMACGGRVITDLGRPSPQSGPAEDRLLVFPRGGGALCSADGGRTWSPRCAARD